MPKEKGVSLAELIDEVSDSWLTKELEELGTKTARFEISRSALP